MDPNYEKMKRLVKAINTMKQSLNQKEALMEKIWFEFFETKQDYCLVVFSSKEKLNYNAAHELMDLIDLPDLTIWLPAGSEEESHHNYKIPYNENITREMLKKLYFYESHKILYKE